MKKLLFAVLCTLANLQVEASHYGRVYLGYTVMGQEYTQTDNGAHLGWLGAFNITKDKLPLYFQYGLECVYAGASVDYPLPRQYGDQYSTSDDEKGHENMFSLAVPLSLAYRIDAGKVVLEPFIGPSLRLNIVGNVKSEGDLLIDYRDNEGFNHLQMGMNIGLGVNIKRFYLGYRFNPDITEYYDNVDSRTMYHHVSVGWNFK